jgi:hypothetical protein
VVISLAKAYWENSRDARIAKITGLTPLLFYDPIALLQNLNLGFNHCLDRGGAGERLTLTAKSSTRVRPSSDGQVIGQILKWVKVSEQLQTVSREALFHALNCLV